MTITTPRPCPDRAPQLSTPSLDQVTVHQHSIFAPTRDRMLHLARAYPVDRLLAVFRGNAGLDTRGAQPPGGWEDWGHPQEEPWSEHDYPGRENAQTASLLRGHYAGHFLSMLALAAAGTGEHLLREKAENLVEGLAQCQRALADTGRYSHPGFLAAYGEWQFSRLESYAPYGEIWAPYYTTHKILAGLIDAYELLNNRLALEVATSMGRWVHHRLHRLPAEQLQKMWSLYIAGEFGGMNESLARLAHHTGDPTLLTAAQLFDQTHLLSSCAAGDDVLDGMHANQHIPQFIGYLHEYDHSGDDDYLKSAQGLFDMVVPGRTYAHGGSGESELWGPADTVAGDIGRRNAETCVAYNMLKLARELFCRTREPKYMDYYEKALTNQILGSRLAEASDTSPEVTYMFPVHPGAHREFGNIGTCCGGTGLENHVKYQDTIFFTEPGATWVNLYSPSSLSPAANGFGLSVEGDYPYAEKVQLRVTAAAEHEHTLHLRIPDWVKATGDHGAQATGGNRGPGVVVLSPTGTEAQRIDAPQPGTYLPVTRQWKAGEVVELTLPMRLRAVPTRDDPTLQYLMIGPIILAARSEQTHPLKLPLAAMRVLDGGLGVPQHPTATSLLSHLQSDGRINLGGVDWEPVHRGQRGAYHMYVTADDLTVGFAGVDSGAPNRLRNTGETVLDSIWAQGGFADRAAFLSRVGEVVEASRREGVLSAEESQQVLLCAATAAMRATGITYEATVRSGAAAHLERHQDGNITSWLLPADWEHISAPPILSLQIHGQVSPTGWHCSHPTVSVHAERLSPSTAETSATNDATAATQVPTEYQIDDGPWLPYHAPFTVEAEGLHTVRARLAGPEGTGNLDQRRLRIDTEPPQTSPQVLINGSGAEIRLRATDTVSGVERLQWQGPGTFWATYQGPVMRALSDHQQIIEFAATDVAGNEEPRQQIVLPARHS